MKPLKIMVVDDDEKIIFAFRKVIEKDGHISSRGALTYHGAFDLPGVCTQTVW